MLQRGCLPRDIWILYNFHVYFLFPVRHGSRDSTQHFSTSNTQWILFCTRHTLLTKRSIKLLSHALQKAFSNSQTREYNNSYTKRRRNALFVFGTFYPANNWEKTRAIRAACMKSMNAQGQVTASLLSARLTAIETLDIFTAQSSWDLVCTNKSENSIWEYVLMAHACKAHAGQIDGMLWLQHSSNVLPRVFPSRPIYKLGDL